MAVGRGGDADLAVRLAAVGPGDDVVDVGCGPGRRRPPRRRRRRDPVVGVDPAPVMLRVAACSRPSSRPSGPSATSKASAEALPLPDGSASVVWSMATVHHWPDLAAGLAEVRRVLRPPGGFSPSSAASRPGATGHASHGWTDEQVERFADECRGAGFVDIGISTHRASRRDVVAVLARVPRPASG